MKKTHKNIWIPQPIVSCLTNHDIEIKQNFIISHNTYDIQYEKGTQKHMDTPTHRFLSN